MLAEAAVALGLGERCLIDAGDPATGRVPSRSRVDLADATQVFVVGGPAALPDTWLLDRLSLSAFTRVAGADRWATQANVAAAIVALARGEAVQPYDPSEDTPLGIPANGDCAGTAVLAKLSVREDRAAANMLTEAYATTGANSTGRCLIDAGDPSVPDAPTAQARRAAGSADEHIIVGGPAAIPDSWARRYFNLAAPTRAFGADRWATQAAVAERIVGLAGRRGGVATLRDHVVPPTAYQMEGLEARASRGGFDVLTFICASASKKFTLGFLDAEIVALNQNVASFFDHQSSETVQLAFSRGGIIDGINDSTGTRYGAKSGVPTWGHAFSASDETTRACEAEARAIAGSSNPYIYVFVDLPLGGLGGWAYFDGFATQPLRSFFQDRVGDTSRGSNAFYNTVAHEIGHSIFRLGHVHQDKFWYRSGHSEKVYVPELADDPYDRQNKYASKCSIMSYCDKGTQYGVDTSQIWVACGQRELLGWPRGPKPPLGPACDFGPGEDLSVPSAPTAASDSVVSEDGRIVVSWLPPSDDGGGIDEYRVTLKRLGVVVRTASTNAVSIALDSLTNGQEYTIEIRAANEAGQSEPLVLTGTPSVSAVTASVSSVYLYQGASSNGCVNYQDIDDCAWFDIDVEFTEGELPSSVAVTCHTSGSNNDRAWRIRTVKLNSDREELATGTSTELDRVCRYALPGNSVYVTVDGVASWELDWPGRPPDAPGNLRLTPGDGQVTVEWDAPDDNGSPITNYWVAYRPVGGDFDDIVEYYPSATARSWTISGLENGVEYEVFVVADNDEGASDVSTATATPTADAQPPDAPARPRLTPGDGQVTVEWDRPDDNGSPITGYAVVLYVDGVLEAHVGGIEALPGTFLTDRTESWVVTDLENGIEYGFRVRAENSEGSGDWSPIATATPTADAQVPDAPDDVWTHSDDGQVTISWAEPDDNGSPITSYALFFRRGTSGSFKLHGLPTLSNQRTITGLDDGIEYQFYVQAVNAVGTSVRSPIVTAVAGAVPGAPANLRLTPGDGQITVQWDAPDDNPSSVASYVVYWTTDVGVPTEEASWREHRLSSSARSWTIPDLTNGVEYRVDVSALNAWADDGNYSSATATPMAEAQVPGAPGNLLLTPGDGEITVEWDAPDVNASSVASYVVFWTTDVGVPTEEASWMWHRLSSSARSWTIPDLTNGVEYRVDVSALNASDDGYSSSATATPVAVPDAPGVPLLTPGDGQITVEWVAPEDNGASITRYRVLYKASSGHSSGFWQIYSDSIVTAPPAVIGRLSNGVEYQVKVRALNSEGFSDESPIATVTAGVPLAPGNLRLTPGDGEITVEWDAPDDNGDSITHYTLAWRSGDGEWNLPGLPDGEATQATIVSLENGVEYQFSIAAWNSRGQGSYAPVMTATPSQS